MSVTKTGWSIIPRKCNCGCNRMYFSPMWKMCTRISEIHKPDSMFINKEYEYFSVKEFHDSESLPKKDIRLTDNIIPVGNVHLVSDYTVTDADWAAIQKHITKNEFLTINYNIHVYPLSISGVPITGIHGLHYVALCVQEIPDIIAIGPDYTTASTRLNEKLERWYDEHQTSEIPKPQEYDNNFVLSDVFRKSKI